MCMALLHFLVPMVIVVYIQDTTNEVKQARMERTKGFVLGEVFDPLS